MFFFLIFPLSLLPLVPKVCIVLQINVDLLLFTLEGLEGVTVLTGKFTE